MFKKIIALIVVLGLAGAVWFYWGRSSQNQLILYGNVDQRQVELAFIDSERIAEVLVQEGATVQAGQVLARLETRRLRDRIAIVQAELETAKANLLRLENGTRPEEIDQAKASVDAAQAEVRFRQASYKRYASIWKQSSGQAVSKQDVDQAFLQLAVAQANLVEAQKALRLAVIGPRDEDILEARAKVASSTASLVQLQNQLTDAELISPSLSVVNRRLLEVGDMASPSRPVFSLAVLTPKWVRAYVSESELGFIKPDMQAHIYTDSHPDTPILGTVGFISSVAEFTPKTVETTELRTALVYEVRIYVEDPDNQLRLGMPATVTFPDLALADSRVKE